jgi:hypothetical protein
MRSFPAFTTEKLTANLGRDPVFLWPILDRLMVLRAGIAGGAARRKPFSLANDAAIKALCEQRNVPIGVNNSLSESEECGSSTGSHAMGPQRRQAESRPYQGSETLLRLTRNNCAQCRLDSSSFACNTLYATISPLRECERLSGEGYCPSGNTRGRKEHCQTPRMGGPLRSANRNAHKC